MNLLSPQGERHSASPADTDGSEPVQDSSFKQRIDCDISLSRSDEEVPLSQDINSEAALIYGGAISSAQSPSSSQTPTPEAQSKSSDRNSSPSRSSTWSTSVQTLLDQPPSTLPQRLVLGGMAFCIAFGAWATFGQIDEVGHAQGRLVPKGELQQTLAEAARLQAELTQREAEGRKTQLESQQQIQQLEVDITQLKAKIADTKNQLTTAKTKLQQKFLYASVNGIVSSLNVRNKGEVVQPGQTVAELAPQGAPLELSAVLPNREAGFVKVGMPVQVKLDAYPYQDYGIIHGKVTSISPDAKPDEKLGPVYRVTVTLDQNYVTGEKGRIQFKAGQTASADIVIRQRHIADILLDPFRQLRKDGLKM